ncbi:MerR family DNA-binding transcriptional regulator [Microlunatus elymi]|uniref:MerR family DNA-binding transcriptional regulator n=1 Tax=Microlunatus elymi TaxID=2596828 RepID=A0A516PVD4_9ACTN|nr:MerR family DNA-binding transcriptional regulator [Microlunatus elymi]
MVPGGDPPTDWWTTEDVANALGVSASTIRAYLARSQMPTPDRTMGNMRLWRPETIQEWHASRPRKRQAQKRERG